MRWYISPILLDSEEGIGHMGFGCRCGGLRCQWLACSRLRFDWSGKGRGSRIKMVNGDESTVNGLPIDQMIVNKGWPTSHPIFDFLCTLYTTSAPKGSTVTMSLVPPNLELV